MSAILLTGGSLTPSFSMEWGRHFLNLWPEALMSQACGLLWQLWGHQGWRFQKWQSTGVNNFPRHQSESLRKSDLWADGTSDVSTLLTMGKKPLLQEVSPVAPRESEQCQDQRNWQGPWGESHPTELNLLLADALVPKTQKLQHVTNRAQKFLSHPSEKHGVL